MKGPLISDHSGNFSPAHFYFYLFWRTWCLGAARRRLNAKQRQGVGEQREHAPANDAVWLYCNYMYALLMEGHARRTE